jgi:hypothetical protein
MRFLEKQKRVFHSFFVSLFLRGAGMRKPTTPGVTRWKTCRKPCPHTVALVCIALTRREHSL